MRFLRKLHEARHALRGERRFAFGHGHGPGEGGPGRGRFGRGGRVARFLEHGDLKLLVLHLINEKPRHGYEIIKAIEDFTGGSYAPSPGVIYPTLTLLEELGQVTSVTEGARKNFSITEDGANALAAEQPAVDALIARLGNIHSHERSLPIMRAAENLRTVLRLKLAAGERKAEMVCAIVEILDNAVRRIEEL
jgi:DNA-binding PadR family transcriptional regulator